MRDLPPSEKLGPGYARRTAERDRQMSEGKWKGGTQRRPSAEMLIAGWQVRFVRGSPHSSSVTPMGLPSDARAGGTSLCGVIAGNGSSRLGSI